jgi:hypothetical protein
MEVTLMDDGDVKWVPASHCFPLPSRYAARDNRYDTYPIATGS